MSRARSLPRAQPAEYRRHVGRAFRLLSMGTDLRVPDVDLEILDAGELDEDEAVSALRDYARDHGAVLALLEDHNSELVPVVVMRADAVWNILEVNGELQGIFVKPRDGGPLVALAPDSVHLGAGRPCPRTRFVQRRASGWSSETWQLFPHPCALRPGRTWCWRGARNSFGPHSLTIHCAASMAAIDNFLSALAPMPYVRVDATRYGASPELEEDQSIEIREGQLSWIRRCGEPRPPLAMFDTGILHAIADGALGAIDWLAWEHDWETPVALGDDGPSLADYLSGDETRVDAAQVQRLKLHHLPAEGLTTAELIGRLSLLLGASTAIADEDFDAWLVRLVLEECPRYVSIQVAGSPSGLYDRLSRCQGRIVWRVVGRG
jgi:hypothetical protein